MITARDGEERQLDELDKLDGETHERERDARLTGPQTAHCFCTVGSRRSSRRS